MSYRSPGRGRISGSGSTGVSSFFDTSQLCRPGCRWTDYFSRRQPPSFLSSWKWSSFSGCCDEALFTSLTAFTFSPCISSYVFSYWGRDVDDHFVQGAFFLSLGGVLGQFEVGWRACDTSILQLHTIVDLSDVFLCCWIDQDATPPPMVYQALLTSPMVYQALLTSPMVYQALLTAPMVSLALLTFTLSLSVQSANTMESRRAQPDDRSTAFFFSSFFFFCSSW